MKGNKKTIFIVDDHPIVVEGIIRIIEREEDFSICGEAEDAPEALASIIKLNPDLVITDLSLKSSDGLELVKEIKLKFPELPVLVVSMHEEFIYAERALRAGAKGYIMKSVVTEEIMNAVRRILGGNIYLSDRMNSLLLNKLIQSPSIGNTYLACLSDREIEVLELIGRGLELKDIAEVLKLSVKTIESHREHIKVKLQIKKSSELYTYAFQWFRENN